MFEGALDSLRLACRWVSLQGVAVRVDADLEEVKTQFTATTQVQVAEYHAAVLDLRERLRDSGPGKTDDLDDGLDLLKTFQVSPAATGAMRSQMVFLQRSISFCKRPAFKASFVERFGKVSNRADKPTSLFTKGATVLSLPNNDESLSGASLPTKNC